MIITCIEIFFARFFDVTLGTVRSFFSYRGRTFISALIAFIEVLIWFVAARQALYSEYNTILIPIFYALGYATGTFFGTYITNHYINRLLSIQVVTKKDNDKLIDAIYQGGHGLSIIPLRKMKDNVDKEMLFIETHQKSLDTLIKLIKKNDQKAFIIVNESRGAQNGLIK